MPRNTDEQKPVTPGECWVMKMNLGIGSNVDVDKVRWDSSREQKGFSEARFALALLPTGQSFCFFFVCEEAWLSTGCRL